MSEADDYRASLSPTERAAFELSSALSEERNADLVKRLMSGDPEAKRQFSEMARLNLVEKGEAPPTFTDANGAAIDLFAPDAAERLPGMIGTASESHTDPHLTARQQLDEINRLRSIGRNDAQIREMFDEGRAYTADEHAFARACVEQMQADRAFQQRLFSGDAVARRMVEAASTVLTGRVRA